jgi:hypothetical protein
MKFQFLLQVRILASARSFHMADEFPRRSSIHFGDQLSMKMLFQVLLTTTIHMPSLPFFFLSLKFAIRATLPLLLLRHLSQCRLSAAAAREDDAIKSVA